MGWIGIGEEEFRYFSSLCCVCIFFFFFSSISEILSLNFLGVFVGRKEGTETVNQRKQKRNYPFYFVLYFCGY